MQRFAILFLLLASAAWGQSTPVNFEPSLVHPIAISPSGQRLFVLNPEAGLLRVFSLADPRHPVPMLDVPVGVAPVSLRARSDDEVWVVDSISDAISVVSVAQTEVIKIIPVKDDPADVIFAGNPQRAYVSVSGSDEVQVFDPTNGAFLSAIAVPGKEPRALAVNPQNDRVYVLVFRSGNRTSLLPAPFAPPAPAPTNPLLPPAPLQALVVSLDNPMWAAHPLVLPDIDLVAIDTSSNSIIKQVQNIGTINYDLAVDALTGVVVVGRTDAHNDIRFEPNLKSTYFESGLTFVDVNTNVAIKRNLNPQASAEKKNLALSEPTAIVIDSSRRQIWVASQGSDRIAKVTQDGEVLQRIDLDRETGEHGEMGLKRGPRGLALDSAGQLLYTFNRMSHTLSVIDTSTGRIVDEVTLGFDPMSQDWRRGQGLLYDARLSGNGTVSCASCHVDGEHDLLSWDLGDPGGSMTPVAPQAQHPSFPPNAFPPYDYHPMKGPMVTQTLRGLSTNAPYHWRGDKPNLQAFNGAFESLLGGHELNTKDIDLLAAFLTTISHPGNPLQNLDRTFPPMAAAGKSAFENLPAVAFPGGFQLTCAECHAGPDGAGSEVVLPIPQTFIGPSQPTNTPQLRGLFRRGEAPIDGTASKVGFGFAHDGGLPTIRMFLDIPAFSLMPTSEKDRLVAFLLAFDTGTAPIVGQRYLVNAATAGTSTLSAQISLLQSRALAGDADLVFEGRLDGKRVNLLYNTQSLKYDADIFSFVSHDLSQLAAWAMAGRLTGVVTASPLGLGQERAFGRKTVQITSRESVGTNPQPTFRLEYLPSTQNGRQPLHFSLLGIPQGNTAELLVTANTGLKIQHASGLWVQSSLLLGPPRPMQIDGTLLFGQVKTSKSKPQVYTVQARILGLPGGISYSNALTIKLPR